MSTSLTSSGQRQMAGNFPTWQKLATGRCEPRAIPIAAGLIGDSINGPVTRNQLGGHDPRKMRVRGGSEKPRSTTGKTCSLLPRR